MAFEKNTTINDNVSAAPSYIRIVPAGVVVNEGQGFILTCEADGDPAPTYNWYHNDVMIHEGAVLTITYSLWTEHDGLILCKATNSKGSRQTWKDVDIQPSEAGAYIYRAINGVGTSLDITFNVDIVSGTAPGTPIITGRNLTFQGNEGSLTCTSIGGNPEPTVKWFRKEAMIDDILDTPTVPNITRNTYNYTADISYHLAVFECRVENTVLESYLSATIFLQVYKEPNKPVLTGFRTVLSGTTYEWTCISTGGNPPPKITMRIGNIQFSNGSKPSPVLQSDNTYTVTCILSLAPNISFNGQTLFCDVQHSETRGLNYQTVSLPLIVIDLLTVTIPQSSYSVLIGQMITIPCIVTGTPTQTNVFWRQVVNGVPTNVVINGNSRYTGGSTSTPSLTIINTENSDEGTYVCYATNIVGTSNSQNSSLDVIGGSNAVSGDEGNYICTATNVVGNGSSQQTFLDVTGGIPTVTVVQNQYSVNYRQTVTMICTVQANPMVTSVNWSKIVNGNATSINMNNVRYSGSTVGSPSLTITALELSDKGHYQCSAENSVGTGYSQQTYLDVIGGPPEISIQSNRYTVLLGQTVTLVCTISANPNATSVRWYKVINGVQTSLSTNAGKYNTPTVSSPNLIINSAAQSDIGYYVCTATNVVGTGTSSQTYLAVTGNIPIVTVQESVYSVNIGGSINLVSNIQANPPHTSVTWQKNINGVTTTVTISGRFSGAAVNSPTLTISNVTLDDEGYYVCVATNSVGNGQSSQCFLDVIGSIPTVIIGSDYYPVNYGNTATIECNAVATPTETSISWQKIQNSLPSTVVISGRYQGAVPSVQILSNYYSVEICLSVTLQCIVTANPSYTNVTWNKIVNGQQTNIGSNNRYSGGTTNTPSLTISNAVDTDEGYYICTAANAVGTGQSAQTYVDVTGTIPVVNITKSQYSVTVGSSVIMVCTVSANPVHTLVYWQKDVNGVATNINLSQTSKYSGSTMTSPSLTILNAVIADQGYYKCSAQNSVGTGTSSQIFLDVSGTANPVGIGQSMQGPLTVIGSVPVVTVGQTTYSTNIGNNITIACVVSAIPTHTAVYWTRKINNGNIVTLNPASSTKYSGSTIQSPSLTIIDVDLSDEGNYICHATNAVGTGQSSHKFLDVIVYPPTSIAINPSQITVNESQTIKATCTAQGSPTIKYTWFKGNSNTQLSTGSVLQITSSTRTNAGTYQCRASNIYGNADASVSVDVRYIPYVTTTQPPQGIVGQAITIQCSYVSNPEATNIIWSKGNQGITVDGNKYVGGSLSNPSLTIINLTASDEGPYTCSVLNSMGQSNSSFVTLSVETSFSDHAAALNPDSTISTGEIVTIILACVFVVLLVIGVIVCCYCQDKCASLCGGKKERISPQPAPKRVEIPVYYEEPDESVISLRKLEIPTFKYDTKPSSSETRTENAYSRHNDHDDTSYDFEINQSQVLQSEDVKQLEQRILGIDNTFSDTTCTYEEEEKRRRRRRRKKKRNKHLRGEQMRENEFILEDKRDKVRYYVPRLGQNVENLIP
ncbi:HMCN [Mytilus coruscus]|uniref:HMCN n=1 Tax=Mytilus coruscus TaxID=42192 RepID=A0A6J8B1Q8_MYTCO|nr:HMCN [Mytilus coruscus]